MGLAIDSNMRHLELYDQINSKAQIDSIYLESGVKLPAVELSTDRMPSLFVFNTLKENLPQEGGEFTLYFRAGNKLIALGSVELDLNLHSMLKRLLGSYAPKLQRITPKGIEPIDDDELVATMVIGG